MIDRNAPQNIDKMSKFDKNLTFKPKINENSQKMLNLKSPNRNLQPINEVLYEKGVNKVKESKATPKPQNGQHSGGPASKSSLAMLMTKIKDAVAAFFTSRVEQKIHDQQLYDLLREQGYADERDWSFVEKVYKMVHKGKKLKQIRVIALLMGI